MKKKNVIGVGLLFGLAVANIGSTVASLLMGELWSMTILYEVNIMVVFMSVSAAFILKAGVSPLEKWVRRAALMVLWCIADPICMWLFGHFEHTCGHTNYEMLFKTIIMMIPIMIAVFIACYMIGDRIEKKHLERINNKLSKNCFFESFKNDASIEYTTDNVTVYSFEYENIKYTILKVMKKASNHTVIRLENENVLWEQSYPLGNHPAKEEWVVAKKSFVNKGTVGIIVFNGIPSRICGLDENGYVSAKRKAKDEKDVYVLSSEEFFAFEP